MQKVQETENKSNIYSTVVGITFKMPDFIHSSQLQLWGNMNGNAKKTFLPLVCAKYSGEFSNEKFTDL